MAEKKSPVVSVCFYPSSPFLKNFSLRISPKSVAYPPPSRPDKGAFCDRHGVESGARATLTTNSARLADGEVVWCQCRRFEVPAEIAEST
jgi:hypothetical protein